MPKITIKDIESLPAAAEEFLQALPRNRSIIAFTAPMGGGKTTFISALVKALKAGEEASSPTFSIVNEYHIPGREHPEDTIYHFDFYRLDSPAQAMEIGAEDYFYSGSLCLMEWAENVEEILPDDTLRVKITPQPDGSRVIEF